MQGASNGAPSSSNNNNNNNNNDDENSQAESNNFEPQAPMPPPQQQQPPENQVNHYENVDAAALQQPLGVPAPPNEPNVAQIVNLQQNFRAVPPQQLQQPPQQYYRNDVYDVPRSARNVQPNFYQRRSNLHLDFNRPRCQPPVSVQHQKHQRSFDDTESCYGYGYNNGSNMYERVGNFNNREEPLYQNSGLAVIGHGIGRIERHLSSSCGNIDHYNVGGHYAVLSHSHVGHHYSNIPANVVAQNQRDGVKSFFSCLGGESSQSLSNITNGDESSVNQGTQQQTSRPTGAIPKTKNKQSNKISPKPPSPPVPPPKSSLQYLLLNKWLPLGPDYKIIDFNFMFSGRNCSAADTREGVVQFNGQAEMVEPGIYQPQREYPTMNPTNYPRVIRNTPQLSRLRESEAEEGFRGANNAFRARSESPVVKHRNQQEDPFRNWSFNFENNSFRPAGAVRRITDGTLAQKDFQEQNPRKELPAIVVEHQEGPSAAPQPLEPQPSTSKSSSPSENSSSSTSGGLSSSTTSSLKTGEMKKSENYENLASLQQDAAAGAPASGSTTKQRKKKSTESQSSDSVTLAEEDCDNEDEDAFEELESDID